eukprot:267307_1
MDIRAALAINLERPSTPIPAGLQKTALEHHDALNVFGGDVCAVCLQQEFVDTALLPCRHAFHGGCILQWVEANFSCPLCRRTIEQFLPLEEDGAQRLQFDPAGGLSLAEFDMCRLVERQRSQEIFARFIAIWEQHYLEGNPGTQDVAFKISDDPVKLSMMRSMSHKSIASMHSEMEFGGQPKPNSSLHHRAPSLDHLQLSPTRSQLHRHTLTSSKSYPMLAYMAEERKEEKSEVVSAYLNVAAASRLRAPMLDMGGAPLKPPSPLPGIFDDKFDFSSWETQSEAQGEVETTECGQKRVSCQSVILSKVPPVMEVAVLDPEPEPQKNPLKDTSEFADQLDESKNSDFVAQNSTHCRPSVDPNALLSMVARLAQSADAHRRPSVAGPSQSGGILAARRPFGPYFQRPTAPLRSDLSVIIGLKTAAENVYTSVVSAIQSATILQTSPTHLQELPLPVAPPTTALPFRPFVPEEPMARTSNHLKAGLVAGVATAGLVHAFDGHAGRFLRSVGFVNGLKGGMVMFHSNFLSFSFLRTLHTVMPSVGMYFAVYELMKRNAFFVKDPESRPVAQFGAWMASGAVAAAVGHMIVKPTPLIPLRYAMQFGVFEWAKQRWASYGDSPRPLGPLAVMTTAAVGGVAAHSVIYPVQQLRGALAAVPKGLVSPVLAGAFGTPEPPRPVGLFSRVQTALGQSGLYRGYRPALVRFLPPCVLTATTYEFSLRYFCRNDRI